jgi:hypothetical protein
MYGGSTTATGNRIDDRVVAARALPTTYRGVATFFVFDDCGATSTAPFEADDLLF